jgi:bacterioferritin (cytochrome b1)
MTFHMNTTRSFLTSLSVALLLAVTSSAQCGQGTNGKACCQSAPTAKVKVESEVAKQPKSQKGAVKSSKVVKLFNDVCPITKAPTSASSQTMVHAGYEISVCHPSCIAGFKMLGKAQQTAWIAGFTGANKRTAFPKPKPGQVEKSCCGSCGTSAKKADECGPEGCIEDASKGKQTKKGEAGGACSDCATDAKQGKGKQAKKGEAGGACSDCATDAKQGKGKQAGKGNDASQGPELNGRTTATVPAPYLKRLQSILGEELYARDYYQAASKAFGARKFANLSRAEQRHADAIASAIHYLGGKPVLSHSRPIVVPKTAAESERVCQDIEKLVIKEYKGLIQDCPDPALLKMLNSIQSANQRHLQAVGG